MQTQNFSGIVYLTKLEYETLVEYGSITKDGQVLNFNRGTLYVTTDTAIEEYYLGSTQWDTTPTNSSTKPVTSGGIYTALSGKQDALTAGTNITIQNNVISASGGTQVTFRTWS